MNPEFFPISYWLDSVIITWFQGEWVALSYALANEDNA